MKTWFEGEADSVHLSTDTGEMEVFPGHTSLLGSITLSRVRVKHGDHEDDFLVRRGFVIVERDERDTVRIVGQQCDRTAKMDFASLKEYREFVLGLLAEPEKLSKYQMRFLEGERNALEKTMEIETRI